MKAQELRIGNWVNKQIVSNDVKEFTPIEITIDDFLSESEWDFIESYCFPIPLTNEILNKSGLKSWWGEESYTLARDEDFGYSVIVRNANHNKEIEFAYIKYVHQLQNLFYFLCGEELEIKL